MADQMYVYIWGSAGCGKSRALREVFGLSHSYYKSARTGKRARIMDVEEVRDAIRPASAVLHEWNILVGNEAPSSKICACFDYIFCCDTAEGLAACRTFLETKVK